ncbi:MAG: hypothetical protein Q9222_005687 [Ikaeria aurantiellina]
MRAKRLIQLFLVVLAMLLIALFHHIGAPSSTEVGIQTGGLEDMMINIPTAMRLSTWQHGQPTVDQQPASQQIATTQMFPGIAESSTNYSRVMVVPRMRTDDVAWISTQLPQLDIFIYVADDPAASIHPPKNKGHEVMMYLSYLIDHYEQLPDIILFMHSHRWTHHNNRFLGFDAAQMIRALNGAHVMREGYVNMRCHWSPGCPEWLRPVRLHDNLGKQEETVLEQSWQELFPFDPLPSFLAQPCCAQFALSKERVRSIPRSRFIYYRDWILRTPLSDYVSGRIWEYSWQYLFTRHTAHCPAEHVCYCDAFGICFGGEGPYQQYLDLLGQKTNLAEEIEGGHAHHYAEKGGVISNGSGPVSGVARNGTDRRVLLEAQLSTVEGEVNARMEEAIRRGNDPRLRAEECGRPWRVGDGF